jgi:hypothetical protein
MFFFPLFQQAMANPDAFFTIRHGRGGTLDSDETERRWDQFDPGGLWNDQDG